MMAKIFSGDASRELWDEINFIQNLDGLEDVGNCLYSIGCALQRLETKIDVIKEQDDET
jgi:hypothetical protein